MANSNNFKNKVIIYYCVIFYVLLIYKLLNGMLLFQLRPSFFYLRQDIFTWLFMQTGLHQLLLSNKAAWIIADTLFYSMPALYLFAARFTVKLSTVTAVLMLLVNWCYVQCYTLYPSNSIEGYLGWLLFPFLFTVNKPQTFSFLFKGLRYFFLYLFLSAALWKIIQGGIFNFRQMSGILLYQHNQLLSNSPGYWLSRMYFWLIQHTVISYLLYLAAFIAELSFAIGFFTKKYDNRLAAVFILFLVADHLIMRIPYYELFPLLLTLLLKEDKSQSEYFAGYHLTNDRSSG